MTKPNIKARLKVYLLQGKGITHYEAQRRWGTNRLASYIHRIRQEFLDIGLEIYCTNSNTQRPSVRYL